MTLKCLQIKTEIIKFIILLILFIKFNFYYSHIILEKNISIIFEENLI